MKKLKELREQIGPLVLKQVELENAVAMASERLAGAQNPQSSSSLRSNLVHYKAQLDEVQITIRAVRVEMIEELKKNLAIVRMQIMENMNAFDIEEMRYLENDLANEVDRQTKIVYG